MTCPSRIQWPRIASWRRLARQRGPGKGTRGGVTCPSRILNPYAELGAAQDNERTRKRVRISLSFPSRRVGRRAVSIRGRREAVTAFMSRLSMGDLSRPRCFHPGASRAPLYPQNPGPVLCIRHAPRCINQNRDPNRSDFILCIRFLFMLLLLRHWLATLAFVTLASDTS